VAETKRTKKTTMQTIPSTGSFGKIRYTPDDQLVVKTSVKSTAAEFKNEFALCTLENEEAKRYIIRAYQLTITKELVMVFERGVGDARFMMSMFNAVDGYSESLNLMYDVLHALRVLREINVCHRDVKHDNIIVFNQSGRWIYKLADCGLAFISKTNHDANKTGTFVHPVMALAYFQNRPDAVKYDTWDNDVYALIVSFFIYGLRIASLSNYVALLSPNGRYDRFVKHRDYPTTEYGMLNELKQLVQGPVTIPSLVKGRVQVVHIVTPTPALRMILDLLQTILWAGTFNNFNVINDLIHEIEDEKRIVKQPLPPATYVDHTPTIGHLTEQFAKLSAGTT
jgi:serine/threonine protein kinase